MQLSSQNTDILHLSEDFCIYQRTMKIDKTIEIGSTSGVGEEDWYNNSIDMTLFYDFHQSLLESFNL